MVTRAGGGGGRAGALTAGEQRVAAPAARGLADRRIAARSLPSVSTGSG
ncbi:hypothetical protein [Streptomyces sp. SID5910]|nr:hypothetical protein [Streptomyces sp. SID5910]MYR43959.1 hypothetical protein [Streptomyces sp. SID5910]